MRDPHVIERLPLSPSFETQKEMEAQRVLVHSFTNSLLAGNYRQNAFLVQHVCSAYLC